MTFQLKPIRDQVVVIIGATSGMGRETAVQFGLEGAKVIVAARGEAGLQSLVQEIKDRGGEASYQVTDVAEFDQVESLAAFVVRKYGRIDTWVNTAGIWATARFCDLKPWEFERIVKVNLIGQANSLWAALPHLQANIAGGASSGGSIILFSSVLGQLGLPLTSAYAASKHGVIGLIDSVRVELKQERIPISLTTILPFGTNTPIYNTGLSRIGYMPRPAAPVVQPEVVAKAVLYAASNPVRQIYGSGAGKIFAILNQLIPEVMDDVLAVLSTAEHQSTAIVRHDDHPNNVHGIVADYRVRGDFDDESYSESPFVDRQLKRGQDKSDIKNILDFMANLPQLKECCYDFTTVRTFVEALIDDQLNQNLDIESFSHANH